MNTGQSPPTSKPVPKTPDSALTDTIKPAFRTQVAKPDEPLSEPELEGFRCWFRVALAVQAVRYSFREYRDPTSSARLAILAALDRVEDAVVSATAAPCVEARKQMERLLQKPGEIPKTVRDIATAVHLAARAGVTPPEKPSKRTKQAIDWVLEALKENGAEAQRAFRVAVRDAYNLLQHEAETAKERGEGPTDDTPVPRDLLGKLFPEGDPADSTTKEDDGKIDTAIPTPNVPLQEEQSALARLQFAPPLEQWRSELRELHAAAADPVAYFSQRLRAIEENAGDDQLTSDAQITAEVVAIREAIAELAKAGECDELLPSKGDESADAQLSGEAILAELHQFERELLEEHKPRIQKLQGLLNRLAGQSGFGSDLNNVKVCTKVNDLAHRFGVRLRYGDDLVIVRYNLPKDQRGGSFQVRTATKVQIMRYNRGIFPQLVLSWSDSSCAHTSALGSENKSHSS